MNTDCPPTESVIFRQGELVLPVLTDARAETIWLNRQQMAALFDRDVKTIGKHIANALREELEMSTVANFATVQQEGTRSVTRQVEYYNLDMIISVGYRVKSVRGMQFRRWANGVLKNYLLKGYALNQQRLSDLSQIVQVMKRVEHHLDSTQILDVVQQYTAALDLLDDYDHGQILLFHMEQEGMDDMRKRVECGGWHNTPAETSSSDEVRMDMNSVLFGK